MTTVASELQLFIASPSDLSEERARIRAVADLVVTACGVNLGVRIRPTGWEDIAPNLGRPQDLINPLVDSCDIFVGLLHRRWGSDSGTHSSGFAEEWERVVSRRDTGNAPAVALFFKHIDEAEESDPGPQLTKVIEFRKRIGEEHVALYREFVTAADFDQQLFMYLAELVTKRASERAAQEERPGPVQAVAQVTPQLEEPSESDSGLNAAQEQVLSVLDGYRQIVGGHEAARTLDRDRLLLLALAVQQDGVMPTHVANRLFVRREGLALLVGEGERWLETLAADYASDNTADMVIPGWQLVGGGDLPDELALMATAGNAAAARGALKMLTALRARPGGLWPDRSGPWTSLLSDSWRSREAMDYLATVANSDDLPMLNALAQASPGESISKEIQALIGVLAGDLAGLVGVVRDSYASRGWAHDVLGREIRQLPDEMLVKVVNEGRPGAKNLRRAGFQELANRGTIDSETLAVVLADSDLVLNEFGVAFVQDHREMADGLLAALKDKKATSAMSILPHLMALSLPAEELRHESESPLNSDQWDAILLAEPVAMADEARHVLAQGDEAWAAEAATRAPVLADENDLLAYLYGKRATAAALLLGRLEPQLRQPGDVALVRQAIARGRRFAKADMAVALVGLGEAQDARLLVEVSKRTLSDEKQRLVDAGLKLGGPDLARSLVDDPDPSVAEAGALALAAEASVTSDELQVYLQHSNAKVRVAALSGVIARSSREELQVLLSQYISSPSYFYNVSAGLDRCLYAPEAIGNAGRTAGTPS